MNDAKLIHVVTGCLFNQNAELLVVRKRNTERFMLPGGKPEAGESPPATLLQHHIIPALQRFLSGPGAAPVD